MIISASRRTDIPAFFGDWFLHRIKEGFFYSVNPMNPKQVRAVSLKPQDVDAIVFWTKNPRPFIKHLSFLDERGYRYYFHFTLNDYPRLLEPRVPRVEERIEAFRELSRLLGRKRVIWRYDPIIISSLTPEQYHLEKINALAESLEGCTERLVISFVHYYAKVQKRLRPLAEKHRLRFTDPARWEFPRLLDFAAAIGRIGRDQGLQVFTCAQDLDLQEAGIQRGSCVDGTLINALFNARVPVKKDPHQRPECLCAVSVDVGVYNTCPFQCAYCYANYSEKAVTHNLAHHHVQSPVLVDRYLEGVNVEKSYLQMSLFQ